MIVKELPNEFIMIEQDNHAQMSGEMITKWKDELFRGQEFKTSVEYAIFNHDFGWKGFDKQPMWNGQRQAPYTFIDFPAPLKLELYKQGIDAVAQNDFYAALLCSEHYTRFLLKDGSEDAKSFVKQERVRQHRIIETLPDFDKQLFDFHYGLLQLCDNLSLYMCLNEPNLTEENEHPFFRSGVPIAPALTIFKKSKMMPSWFEANTIEITEFPFDGPFTITMKQKTILKKTIMDQGLAEAYQATPFKQINIRLIVE